MHALPACGHVRVCVCVCVYWCVWDCLFACICGCVHMRAYIVVCCVAILCDTVLCMHVRMCLRVVSGLFVCLRARTLAGLCVCPYTSRATISEEDPLYGCLRCLANNGLLTEIWQRHRNFCQPNTHVTSDLSLAGQS